MNIHEIAQAYWTDQKALDALTGLVEDWLALHPGEHSTTALLVGLQAGVDMTKVTKLLYAARTQGKLMEGVDYRRDEKRKHMGHARIVWLGSDKPKET